MPTHRNVKQTVNKFYNWPAKKCDDNSNNNQINKNILFEYKIQTQYQVPTCKNESLKKW